MTFLLNCTNKGCGSQNIAAEYSPEDDQVYCPDCGKTISNTTIFVKNQLKSQKQVRKAKKEAFSVVCQACKHQALPNLEANQLVCAKCQTKLTNVPGPFVPLIKEAIRNKQQEELEDRKSQGLKK